MGLNFMGNVDPWVALALVGASLGASWVSGVTGLAGGTLLFSALTYFWPLQDAMALHAASQTLSNGTRLALFWGNIRWDIVARFTVPILPSAYLGASVLRHAPSDVLFLFVGIGIFAAIALPKKEEAKGIDERWFWLSGGIAGFLGMVMGVVGPLIAPFFLHLRCTKEEFIATKSACQLITQGVKLVFFIGMLDFSFAKHGNALVLLLLGILSGTALAKRSLGWLSKRGFAWAVRILLAGSALQMCVRGAGALLGDAVAGGYSAVQLG